MCITMLFVCHLKAELLNFSPDRLCVVKNTSLYLDIRHDASHDSPCPGFEVKHDTANLLVS